MLSVGWPAGSQQSQRGSPVAAPTRALHRVEEHAEPGVFVGEADVRQNGQIVAIETGGIRKRDEPKPATRRQLPGDNRGTPLGVCLGERGVLQSARHDLGEVAGEERKPLVRRL